MHISEDKRVCFQNSHPLTLPVDPDRLGCLPHWQLSKVKLSDFPLIEDFAVITKETESFGQHLFFTSPSIGTLTTFPWWDHVDQKIARYTNGGIPTGTLDRPFFDCEQGWQILIFNEGEKVFVLQSDDLGDDEFHSWYCIKETLYNFEWFKTFHHFHI